MNQIDWEKEGAGGDFTVYPEGTYKVTIDKVEPVTASTGTKQLRWKATIIEPKDFIGKSFTIHTALTEKALWRVARLVKGCGIDLKSLGKMEIGSVAFNRVIESCRRRTTFWHVLVVPDNKGRDKNDVDDFIVDNEQDIEGVPLADETEPEFLK